MKQLRRMILDQRAHQLASSEHVRSCARRTLAAAAFWLLLFFVAVDSQAQAQDHPHIPRQHHAWARFAPGSWKLVRIVTENFDANGRATAASVTETKTTLKDASDDGFTLLIQSTVELDGKRIASEPQTVSQRYNGALSGQVAQSRRIGNEAITIDGQSFPCQLHQYEISGTAQKTITRTHYCPDTAPYVLRRETTALETGTNSATSRVLVEVQELNVPHMACGQSLPSARLRVTQRHVKGTETTLALSSMLVPGGVVWHDSSMVGPTGRKLSHSKLELIDFHVVARDEAPPDAQTCSMPLWTPAPVDARAKLCRPNYSSRWCVSRRPR